MTEDAVILLQCIYLFMPYPKDIMLVVVLLSVTIVFIVQCCGAVVIPL